jgi:anti-sigma factor RsiW
MKDCEAIDALVTPYVDGEASHPEAQMVAAHLRACPSCRARVEAEASARHLLRAYAAVSKTLGETPSWRPRAFRLGRPALTVLHPAALAGIAATALALAAVSVRILAPAPISAAGVISDSYCARQHRFAERAGVDEATCTLGCVKAGAEFVLVSADGVYHIRNQDVRGLMVYAGARVDVTGTVKDRLITIERIAASGH